MERLGARSLLDATAKSFRDGGLGYLSMTDGEVVERLLRDNRLIRVPLIRHGTDVTVGRDEATWASWLRPAGAPPSR